MESTLKLLHNRTPMSPRVCAILCTVIAIAFGAISYSAILGKSATFDEPTHFGSGYAHVFYHDDRTDPENPPLWKAWAMLPIHRADLKLDPNDKGWREAGALALADHWSIRLLFVPRAEPGMTLINRSRFVMMLIGVALCLATAWWAYQIAGPWAAISAALLIALDPTCLAHASLVKNDVALALAMLAAMIATWRAGRRLSWLNALAIALACAVAVNVKYSAVLVPIIVALALLLRAILPGSWTMLGREVESRQMRWLVTPAILLLIGVVTTAVTWAAYGFQYAPSRDPALAFDATEPFTGGVDHIIRFAEVHRLLPEAFCVGFLRLHSEFGNSPNFLLGVIQARGWWYYFPLAFIVKTPLATLAAIAIAAVIVFRLPKPLARGWWSAICLALPTVIYLVAAMQSDLDHGVRHLLPIYPMIFIAVGVIFARSIQTWPRASKLIGGTLLIALAIESLATYPNFIPFFNLAAGGSRGGLAILSDSNLDWGQDLPLLAKWQREHPDVRLYATTFGVIDPSEYGIQYYPLPGYLMTSTEIPPDPKQPGVLAISATILQGVYVHEPWNAMYAEIRTWKPREVLGGSIYLYDWPSREMAGIK